MPLPLPPKKSKEASAAGKASSSESNSASAAVEAKENDVHPRPMEDDGEWPMLAAVSAKFVHRVPLTESVAYRHESSADGGRR